MKLLKGEIVCLHHYSNVFSYRTYVINVENEFVKLALTDDFAHSKSFEGDPIVLICEKDKEVYTCESVIKELKFSESYIKLKIDNYQAISNSRVFERFPVSLFANIKFNNIKKRNTAIIKNVSLEGMSFFSKVELKQGEKYVVDIYLDEKIIPLDVEVAWKKKGDSRFEYGLKTQYADYIVKNTVKLYLQILKEEQMNSLKI